MRLISQIIKGISDFFKNYLNILMTQLFQHFLYQLSPATPAIFCLNLNEAMLSAAWKLASAPVAVKADSSL